MYSHCLQKQLWPLATATNWLAASSTQNKLSISLKTHLGPRNSCHGTANPSSIQLTCLAKPSRAQLACLDEKLSCSVCPGVGDAIIEDEWKQSGKFPANRCKSLSRSAVEGRVAIILTNNLLAIWFRILVGFVILAFDFHKRNREMLKGYLLGSLFLHFFKLCFWTHFAWSKKWQVLQFWYCNTPSCDLIYILINCVDLQWSHPN